jgi:arylsulfatase A-like enzyme
VNGHSSEKDGTAHRSPRGATGRVRIALTLFCVALSVWIANCNPREEAPSKRPNLLLVIVDTLRADHLGSYGHARETSPAIDAFAKTAIRFDRAYAAAPWTKPSVASMITGRYPAVLGIDNIFSRLPQSAVTLAETLHASGYRTAGVVSHVMLSNKWEMGFGQGYETYIETEARGHRHISTTRVTDQAIALLEGFASGADPFLLFVHYFDPHFDYLDHADTGFASVRSDSLDGTESIIDLRERIDELSPADFAFLRDRYDEEIRHTDTGVGRLLAALARLDLERDTAVVFASDHGEQFGEKGWIGHTPTLYEMVVRVPLIIRPPGGVTGPHVVDQPVSLVSLMPTMLEMLGVESTDPGFQGRSFANWLLDDGRAEADAPTEDVFIEIDFPLQDPRISPVRLLRRAMVGKRFKLIVDDAIESVELYDIESDPDERTDVANIYPGVRDRMLRELRARIASSRAQVAAAESIELSDAELEVLRKLGYVEAAQ